MRPGSQTPLLTEWLTYTSENITLPQTSFAGGTKAFTDLFRWFYSLCRPIWKYSMAVYITVNGTIFPSIDRGCERDVPEVDEKSKFHEKLVF